MLAELTREDLSTALDTVAESLLREADIHTPPIHAFKLAARLGIAVAPDDGQKGRARYVRLRRWAGGGPQPAILLRADPRPEREHWAVAHEIGEHAAYRVFDQLAVDPRESPAARESVANWLAARLLLPSEWFHADGRACDWSLAALKQRYATASHELIARRMVDAPPPVVVSVFDNERLVFRRGNLSDAVGPPSAAENDCRRKAHQSGLPCSATHPGCRIDAWPVHEPGWRREILRMEIDEYCD